MESNPINSTTWRARFIKRGGTEKELRELYLMFERSFNRPEEVEIKWCD